MSAYQVRKSLAFARRTETKQALGWWGVTVYNWCRSHCSLRHPLPQPLGKKVPAAFTSDGVWFSGSHFHGQEDSPHASLPPTGMKRWGKTENFSVLPHRSKSRDLTALSYVSSSRRVRCESPQLLSSP